MNRSSGRILCFFIRMKMRNVAGGKPLQQKSYFPRMRGIPVAVGEVGIMTKVVFSELASFS